MQQGRVFQLKRRKHDVRGNPPIGITDCTATQRTIDQRVARMKRSHAEVPWHKNASAAPRVDRDADDDAPDPPIKRAASGVLSAPKERARTLLNHVVRQITPHERRRSAAKTRIRR